VVIFFRRHSGKARLKKDVVDGPPASHAEAEGNRASLFPGSPGSSGEPPGKRVRRPAASARADTPPTAADETERSHADLAALLVAVVVIILTVTLQPGAWGYIPTIAGSVLLCLLVAFFARHPAIAARAQRQPESFFVALALAALVGIAGAFTGAWPVQSNFFRDSPYCRAVGVNAATSAVRDLSGIGLGNDGIGATPTELRSLIQSQLSSPTPVDDGTALGAAFSQAYYTASGNCLADDTTDHLWFIALPLFAVTLIWWSATFSWMARRQKKAPENRNYE